ncbi:MAG: hypothetical protein ABJA76_23185 [Mucilaginibacter sp.]
MKIRFKQIKQILVIAILLLSISQVIAQPKQLVVAVKQSAPPAKPAPMSAQLTEFIKLTTHADVNFKFPKGFKEIKAPDNEDLSFDYAMTLPGKDFEIWLQVKSQKENWYSYENARGRPNAELANPDSTYKLIAQAHAAAFTGENSFFVKPIPSEVLTRYNADAGKSYLLTLLDLPETKHYKYALLITLQKDHTGIIVAVCFTNEKGPEFFKNMDRASNCLKFKQVKNSQY